MSDAVALNPVSTSPSSAKPLIEKDNKPLDEHDPAAFANVLQAVIEPPSAPPEIPPILMPGGELPVANAELPPDLAANGLLGAVPMPFASTESGLMGATAGSHGTLAAVPASGARTSLVKSMKQELAPAQAPVAATTDIDPTLDEGFSAVHGAQGQAEFSGDSFGGSTPFGLTTTTPASATSAPAPKARP